MEASQFRAGGGEGVEVRSEGDAGELAFEVGSVALAILGMVEQRVDVVEDGFFGDGVVGVVLAESG